MKNSLSNMMAKVKNPVKGSLKFLPKFMVSLLFGQDPKGVHYFVFYLRLGVSTVETNRDRDRERPSCQDKLF